MPGFVTCPNCGEELDIPPELRGSPVRCAACGDAFTPPIDIPAVPVAPRANRAEPRDNPRDEAGRSEDEPRPRRRSANRPPRRGPNVLLWLMLLGTAGFCCLGCAGFIVFALGMLDPTLTDYESPDGRFTAAFPGPVEVSPQPLPGEGVLGPTTVYTHRRTILGGQLFDAYFVRSVELRGDPDEREKRRAVKEVLTELIGDGTEVNQTKANLDGAEATEVQVNYPRHKPQAETLVARVAVIGDRLYAVGLRGQALDKPEQQQRALEFWSRFAVKRRAGD